MKNTKLLLFLFVFTFIANALCLESYTLTSPDKKISVNFWLTADGEPVYSVSHSGATVLKQSKLGIVRSDADFSTSLTFDSASQENAVSDRYTLLHGKRLTCQYTANERVFSLKNVNSKVMEIIFQVSNDGVAFRYHFPETTDKAVTIFKETSSWHFDGETVGK